MKLKDAIERYFGEKPFKLDEHSQFVGITNKEIRLTPDLLGSNDWGFTFSNSDPEFKKIVEGLVTILKDEGPLLLDGDNVSRPN